MYPTTNLPIVSIATLIGRWMEHRTELHIGGSYLRIMLNLRLVLGFHKEKPNVLVYGWAAWYRFVWLPFVGFWFIYVTQEEIYWVSVDPPGATLPPFPPMPGHKLPTPIIIIGRHHRK